ncbi:recombinase family protein [Bacillus sp. 165]|uniref:recombinase family protein n=1 Tax=Bacillus sp. 165 TaxID=1529117 RepID=UPI001ADBC44A|nr:recombinase family protein [Bacillus sp. 165]MBO9128506.1 recombinase family protein [Bacillus sp. 165]
MMKHRKNASVDKKKIFYRRVSSHGQSIEMQINAEEKYRKQYNENDIIEINDVAVSANKVKIPGRTGLVEVMDNIKRGYVDALYVYDRSRLARNFYEYFELIDLFLSNNIKVVFTTTDFSYPPFSNNYLTEGFNAIAIEEEGKGIARRIRDKNKRLPVKKFGYKVEKGNSKKSYVIDDQYRFILCELFDEAAKIETLEEFFTLIMNFSRRLGGASNIPKLVRILSDCFYAASEETNGHYSNLAYVEPVVSLETFKLVQMKTKGYINRMERNVESQRNTDVLSPYCVQCGKQMKYKVNPYAETGTYSCSNKHKKIEVSGEEYNACICQVTKHVLSRLEAREIEKQTITYLNQLIKRFENQRFQTRAAIQQKELDVATLHFKDIHSQKCEAILTQLKDLKKDHNILNQQIVLCEENKIQIGYLLESITHEYYKSLSKQEFLTLGPLIIKKGVVQEGKIEFEILFNRYLKQEGHGILKLEGCDK